MGGNLVQVEVGAVDELKTNSDIAIITAGIGRWAKACLEVTHDRMVDYAKRCGADFHVLEDDQVPEWPIANKFRVAEIAKHYKRVLFIDADVVIGRHSPSLFDVVPETCVAFRDERKETMTAGLDDWQQIEADKIADAQGMPHVELQFAANSGVLMLPSELRHLYAAPEHPTPAFWCGEQMLLTLRMHEKLPFFLDWRFNCQHNEPRFLRRYRHAYFIHANGAKGRNRVHMLKKFDRETP